MWHDEEYRSGLFAWQTGSSSQLTLNLSSWDRRRKIILALHLGQILMLFLSCTILYSMLLLLIIIIIFILIVWHLCWSKCLLWFHISILYHTHRYTSQRSSTFPLCKPLIAYTLNRDISFIHITFWSFRPIFRSKVKYWYTQWKFVLNFIDLWFYNVLTA